MAKTPSDLIFEALCLRYHSTTNVAWVMTRQELQEATGLTAEALVDVLRDLVGPADEDDLPILFVNNDPDKITIGPAWGSVSASSSLSMTGYPGLSSYSLPGKVSYGRQSARFAESTRPTRVNALPICRLNPPLDPRLEPTSTRHIPCWGQV